MDALAIAAGTALVKVMTTEAWSGAKDAIVALWRKRRPTQAEQIGGELDRLRADVIAAQSDPDFGEALAGMWRVKMNQLLADDPTAREELRRMVVDQFTPALSGDDRSTVESLVQHVRNIGSGNTNIQAGGDVHMPPRRSKS